jgi:PKD repeat protein
MKNVSTNIFKLTILAAIAIFFCNTQLTAQNYEKYYQDNSLFVKFVDSYDLQIPVAADNSVNLEDAVFFSEIIEEFKVQKITRPLTANNDHKLLRTFLFVVENHHSLEMMIEKLEQMPEIEYAEKVSLGIVDYQPNDPLYNLFSGSNNWNWHLDVIQAEQAWEITQGNPDVHVAVVDDAIWVDHPDLAGEVVAQWDAIYNIPNANPPAGGNPNDWTHGTHTSGLVTATTDNNIGVASIGFNTKLIAVKSSNNGNPGYILGYQGVNWAINNGAHIVSMSYGGPDYDQSVQNLINAGHNMGVIFFGSAGNDDSPALRYPASYNNVISVASTDEDDTKSWFSSYGTAVDISSPGGSGISGPDGVLSSTYTSTSLGNYDYFFGTSMSCPIAAGLGSLILSINPELSPEQVEEILKSTSDDIDAINPDYAGLMGAGRINAYQAVMAVPFNPQPDFMVEVAMVLPGTTIQFQDLSVGLPDTYEWEFEGGTPLSSGDQNPEVTYDTEGVFNVSLQVSNEFGNNVMEKTGYITVTATPSPWIVVSATPETVCIKEPVTFTDESLYEPNSWNWSFEPDTYEFIDGTNANSQNPVIIFHAPGYYSLTLEATNANGTTTKTFEDFVKINGMLLPYEDDFESGFAMNFELESAEKSIIKIDARAANESDYGIHFTGWTDMTGWTGSPINTTAEQAWGANTAFHSAAYVCNIDATEYAGVYLHLDLRQTYSLSVSQCWFRVMVNDTIQVPDVEGTLNFNPETNEDPFVTRLFNLQPWAGELFSLKLQACTRLYDNYYEEGDNVFIDNVKILGSLVGVDEMVEIPFDRISIFPNPVSSAFTIQYDSNVASELSVTMTSTTGQIVYQTIQKAGIGTTMIPVSASKLPKGVYVVSIKSANGVSSHKVVIE